MVIAFRKCRLPSTISSSGVGTMETPFFRGENRGLDDWWGAQGHAISESESNHGPRLPLRGCLGCLDLVSQVAFHSSLAALGFVSRQWGTT